jgi:hypothetical protein
VWVRTDLSSYLKVVEMHTWSSDWKCVIIIITGGNGRTKGKHPMPEGLKPQLTRTKTTYIIGIKRHGFMQQNGSWRSTLAGIGTGRYNDRWPRREDKTKTRALTPPCVGMLEGQRGSGRHHMELMPLKY